MDKIYDVAVVGAGVIGSFIARELTRYDLKVIVLEKETEVANGASKANSGIVHAGFDALENSNKAKFNVLGNRLMPKVCKQLGVEYKNNGSLVLCYKENDCQDLYALKERGKKNGVKGLKILNSKKLKNMVPNLTDDVSCALYAKTGGIVCPYTLTIASLGNAIDNGATLVTDFNLTSVCEDNGILSLKSDDNKQVKAKLVVNASGFGTQKVANLFGDYSFETGARKGEYILLDKSSGKITDYTLFTLPTKLGKGILVSPTVHGNLLLGPTAVAQDDCDTSIRKEGFAEIIKNANKMVSNIPYGEVITSFAGVRAYCVKHDFIIGFSKANNKLYNVCGIESPGLTSAPAIGEHVAKEIANYFSVRKKYSFNKKRKSSVWFKKLSVKNKNSVIKKHPEYGKVVCRCENVTVGEILEALRTNPKATTIDGVKHRTRAGMGRCQGGFCQPSVFNLVMKEYGYTAKEVTKNGKNSYIITGGEL